MITINLKKRVYTSLSLLLLVFLIIKSNFILVFCLIVMGVISLLEFFNISKKIMKNNLIQTSSNLFFIIYMFSFCYMFFFLSNFPQLKLLLFLLLFGCIGSDIGGYIIGKLVKGPKLTKLSPNKTLAGAVGGIIFTGLFMSVAILYITKNLNYLILIIALVTSISCQLGDLLFSFLKRKAKIKDTGNFLPGHGGILDRVDGILLGIPLGFVALILLY